MPFGDRRSGAERWKLALDEFKADRPQGATKLLDALVEFNGRVHHLGRRIEAGLA